AALNLVVNQNDLQNIGLSGFDQWPFFFYIRDRIHHDKALIVDIFRRWGWCAFKGRLQSHSKGMPVSATYTGAGKNNIYWGAINEFSSLRLPACICTHPPPNQDTLFNIALRTPFGQTHLLP